MSITITERWGRRISKDRAERSYKAVPTDGETEDDIYAAVWAAAPSSINGLYKDDINCEEADGGAMWTGTVSYITPDFAEPETSDEDMTFSFDGGSTRITQAIAQVSEHIATGTAPDPQGAIGVGRDGSIEGVEVDIRAFQFSKIVYLPKATVNSAYLALLYKAVGKVNSDSVTITTPWGATITFAIGELRLKNAVPRYRKKQDDVEIRFDIIASENRTGIAVGDTITPFAKKGHEYMWVYYAETTSYNRQIMQPIAAYVDQVYETTAFVALGIGT